MGILRLLIGVLLLLGVIGAAVFGVRWISDQNRYTALAKEELAKQEAEIGECKKRLQQLHGGWKRYRADHKGGEPPSVEVLLPKYVSRPEHFLCPTAKRWTAAKKGVSGGSIKHGGKTFTESYGMRWLTASYARDLKYSGEKAPLIACYVHREVVFRAAYNKPPELGSFSEEERGKLVAPVRSAEVLTVLRDGSISALKPDQE